MKRLITCCVVWFLIILVTNAQYRPKFYDLDKGGSVFQNMIQKNDTIITYGAIGDTIKKLWGIVLSKIDTNGVILKTEYYFDTTSNYIIENNNQFLLDNGYYYLLGSISRRGTVFFKKTDVHFKELFTTEIPLVAYANRFPNIIKMKDSLYLCAGTRDDFTTNQSNGYFYIINSEGKIIKDITLDKYVKYGSYLDELIKVNDNKFLITGVVGISDSTYKSRILTIDSLGNVTNTWYSVINEHPGIQKLILLADSSMIYSTRQFKVVNGEGFQRTLLVKRDKFMNVLWQRTFNEEWSNYYNQPIDLKETPDGNYILAHDKGSIKNSSKPNVLLTCLFKFNANGDSIWSREDTVIYSEKFGVANNMGGITVLPSGSIVVCGYSNAPIDGSVRSIAWLYKVNKDGCMDFCNTSGFLDLEATEQKLKVFPNPTSNNITVSAQNPINDYEVYNIYGQCILKNYSSSNQITLNVENWQNGIYYLKTKDSFGKINSVNILVQK